MTVLQKMFNKCFYFMKIFIKLTIVKSMIKYISCYSFTTLSYITLFYVSHLCVLVHTCMLYFTSTHTHTHTANKKKQINRLIIIPDKIFQNIISVNNLKFRLYSMFYVRHKTNKLSTKSTILLKVKLCCKVTGSG